MDLVSMKIEILGFIFILLFITFYEMELQTEHHG